MLKVSKTNSKRKFQHFKDDNEFCQFAIDPNLVITTDRCVIDGKNIASYDFKFTDSYNKAIEDGNTNMIDSASLMKFYGHELWTVPGNVDNIKITTPADFYTFKALYEVRENQQIFGF